jgi:hypothetical protein
MESDSGGPAFRNLAKEYARFCRIHALFLVDGLEPWQAALKAKGFSEAEIGLRMAAAADLVRRLGEPSSDRRGA